MPEKSLQIGNRIYKVNVEAGQEQRLNAVALKVDQVVGQLRQAMGQDIDRDRLLVLSAITIADELHDIRARQETEKHTLVSFHANLADRLDALSRKLVKA